MVTTDNRTNEPTEALIAEAKRRARKRRGDGWLKEADMLDRLIAALEAATRERDAAVAAVERVRAAVSGHPECDRYEEGDVISCGWKSAYASVVAALDVAPEPEWEWMSRAYFAELDRTLDSPITDEESARVMNRSTTESNPWMTAKLMRRRKAGPWLPVEGESTDE